MIDTPTHTPTPIHGKDAAEFIADFELQTKWFCDRIAESVPTEPKALEVLYERMVNIGWVRRLEVDTYKELIKPEDD